MQSRSKLKPGQKGTKKLVELYGERLFCVRYRYDEQRQKRFKTAEIIIEEAPWTPKPKKTALPSTVALRIAYGEADLRRKVSAAGGKWIASKRLWELSYEQAVALKLEDRIANNVSNTRNPVAQDTQITVSNTRNPKVPSI